VQLPLVSTVVAVSNINDRKQALSELFSLDIRGNKAVLQPLRWRCIDCVIHHERDVREE